MSRAISGGSLPSPFLDGKSAMGDAGGGTFLLAVCVLISCLSRKVWMSLRTVKTSQVRIYARSSESINISVTPVI